MTLQTPFKRVILYARQQRENQDVMGTLQQVFAHLQQHHSVFIDPDTAQCCALDIPVLRHENFDPTQDVMIVVGGDGSLLSAAQIAIRQRIPVIGINRGHLGFLTDISPQDFAAQLDDILKGYYIRESRSLISMHIHQEKTTDFKADALNDVVLSRGNGTRLITFDVFIDDQFVSHYRADGLILATPTGSTAYALSAGGPIMHPQLNAIVIVPMFSHSFSARPLVIDGDSQISLHISKQNDMPLQISCDGHESYSVDPGQHVTLQKSNAQLQLLHPQDYHYYDTLRIKLGWGSEG
ncbi:MAG: NAD(+) kinase [Legionella sp.]|nr:MAG: NAD(+) kinase [Legionella sp.]